METPTNVLLITVDTLRADRLGCYGYPRVTSPNIDALAAQGALAERFFCAGIPTQPSYTTLYTGQHPIRHGVIAHGGQAELAKDAPFLPQAFLREGYTTCAVDNLARIKQWFARGYEFYIDPSVRRPLLIGVTCEELNARIVPWLHAHASEPFFMMLHYWDPHSPLVPPAKYRDLFYQGNPTDPENRSLDKWWEHPLGSLARETWLRRPDGRVTDAAYVEALYDQEVRHLDDAIGELMGTLDQLGIADETLVVLLGDHGESFTEHGIFFDHHGLYDCTIRIPLIVRWPGQVPAGRRLPQLLQHQDVAPTLLEAAGITIPDETDGVSRWPLLTGRVDGDTASGYDRIFTCESTWQAKWSIRTETHKLIVSREPDRYGNPERELYDLIADPGETRNLAGVEPALARELERDLEEWIACQLEEVGRTEDPVRAGGTSIRGV
ncbi:MAG TPA: sulfatase [Chloroflexota bacterium]|jgi:arylsulfatase A-like enzyme|nr:sulfatase [Chloroflexota bacterium]